MERRDVLAAVATGAGFLAGCTGSGVPADGDDPTDSMTPTPVEDGTPTPVEDGTRTPTTLGGSPTGSESPGTPTGKDPLANFPEGPKEPPERPTELTLETVKEFVHTFEYRYVYNEMWFGESTEVHNECRVEEGEEIESGYRVVVSCTAYSNTGGEPVENGTATTTVVHADYFTQTYVYVVTADSITRRAHQGESSPTETPPPSST